jgi:hypothetical protein
MNYPFSSVIDNEIQNSFYSLFIKGLAVFSLSFV